MDPATENLDGVQAQTLQNLIERLERRINRIEEYLELPEITESGSESGGRRPAESGSLASMSSPTSRAGTLEFKIGEYWLAHLGTVALLMGIAFLISYPFAAIPSILSSLFGYAAVAGIFVLSHYWQSSYQYLSRILFSGGLILLYFATLRLHFFSANPVLMDKTIGLAALLALLSLMIYLSSKRDNELLAAMTLFLSYATSLISETTHFALLLITVTSAVAVYLMVRHNWGVLGVAAAVMAYSTHLLWLVNNPIMGNPLQAISDHHHNLVYLFVYAGFFAAAHILRPRSSYSHSFQLVFTLIYGGGFFVIGSLIALTFFRPQLGLINALFTAFYLTSAVVYWLRFQSKYASAVLASLGYMALSIGIFAQFDSPDFFVWLGWQSLLVISTAIWFRSRILIVVNVLIYLGIFCAYLGLANTNGLVNLSYAIVALTSARVLNWKKERLELKTDLIRNAYLASAFVIVLYGLYSAVPSQYVSLSWLAASLFYFAMSLLLRNLKYRWLAILTIFALILHVFLVDLARLGAQLRIILFLAIGSVLLLLSTLYSKNRTRFSEKQ